MAFRCNSAPALLCLLLACSDRAADKSVGAGVDGGGRASAGIDGSVDGQVPSDASSGGDPDANTGRPTADAGNATWWKPKAGTSWQWQLSGALDASYDVAMYDVDLVNALDNELNSLRAAKRIIVCYFSAGTVEDYRDDAKDFAAKDIGKVLPEWPDEKWIDVRSLGVRAIMKKRLDLAVTRGCDGVEPDNVDGYANDNGLSLSKADQLDYNRFLAREAHARGLSVGLKNALDIVKELEPDFDWALNEECLSFDECAALAPFIAQDKAVFHVEYVDAFAHAPAKKTQVCGNATIQGFSTLIKTWDLDAARLACD